MAEATWFYQTADGRAGPLTSTQMCELIAGGKLSLDTLVWFSLEKKWVPAATIGGFRKAAFSAQPASAKA